MTGSRSGTGAGRRLGHVAIGVAGWLAMGVLWAWQLAVYVPGGWFAAVGLLGLLCAGWTCFSLGWVAWCRSIYRRRHRRTTPLSCSVDFAHDALGRTVVAPRGIAEARGQVVVSLGGDGVKRYEFAPRSVSESAASADAARRGRDAA